MRGRRGAAPALTGRVGCAREDPHRRRQPPAVHQGRRRVGAAARAPRGAARAHRPALRRLAVEGLLHRARPGARPTASSASAAARTRSQTARMLRGARAAAGARAARTRCSCTATPTRRSRAAWPGAQAGAAVIHVEAGMRSFDRTMPEELNRVLTDHLGDLLLCSSDTAAANLARESVRGRVEVVGDVMVDVALRRQPTRARRPAHACARTASTPGDYLLLTAHRAGNVDDARAPSRADRARRGAAAAGRVPAAPAHARAPARRRAARRAGAQLDGLRADRAARLRAVQRAAVPGARGRDRLGRRPKGGVPCAGCRA